MRSHNLSIFERLTLEEVEITLDLHTSEQAPVDRYTEFSWSVSRHAMFSRCKRQYYLSYYGARRVREANNPVVSAIWWLKQATPARTYIGSVIHEAASAAVKALQRGAEMSRAEIAALAVETYRAGVLASRRAARHDGQWVVLFEHIYPGDGFSIDPDEAEGLVANLAERLYESEAYQALRGVDPRTIREVDPPFQSFELPGVPELGSVRVFAIPDVLLHDAPLGAVRIVDWKTGSVVHEGIRSQAGVYKLYACSQYGVPQDAVEFVLADLGGGGASVQPPGEPISVEGAEAFARESIYNMVSAMENIRSNTVRIRDFPMTDDRSLCRWCGFRRACWRHEADG